MPHPDLAVVTGAFSYTGRYVTRRLLGEGVRVRTLTRSPDAEDPFGGRVEVAPLDFSDPDGLCRSMLGAGVFYNTYWIRYAHGRTTFDLAVENTRTLFEAAKSAGVGRIVHFSVTNPSSGSGLPYFRGKVQVEDMLVGLGIPYAIIRPTLVFGVGDLLLNNMAWALRRFPVFPVFGKRRLSGPTRLRRRPCGPGGGGRVSEREFHRRRCRPGHILLRGPASPPSLLYGRPKMVPAHASARGSGPDRAGRPADARHGAHPRRGCWSHGWPADIGRTADRHDEAKRLAGRQRGWVRSPVHVRAEA